MDIIISRIPLVKIYTPLRKGRVEFRIEKLRSSGVGEGEINETLL